MKNTIYERMRLGGVLLCLALIAACIVPTAAFAADTVVSEEDSVHFINPTAITVIGDCLYVADNVEDNKTALLCFALNENESPKLMNTYELADKITGLSNNGTDTLFAICGTKILELRLHKDSDPEIGSAYERFDDSDNVQIVSVAYGAQFRLDENTLYALTADKMLYLSAEQNKFIQFTNIVGLNDTKGCYILKENNSSYLYYIANNTCARFNLTSNSGDTSFVLNLAVTPNGIFGGQTDDSEFVGLYNSKGIYKIEGSGNSQSGTLRYDTISLFKDPNEVYPNDSIAAVESHDKTLIVLNSRNQIDLFELEENGYYSHEPSYTIGSDMVNKTAPTEYSNFTLVRPKGYPANIVFKTNDEKSSISEIITDASEYIIIGYDGDKTSHYYYVLIGDKFGWVKKSDGAETPDEDNKLTVIDNNRSDETFTLEAKFTSLNAVYVYKLPLENCPEKTIVTQTASTMKTVKILQEYKEGDLIWYYVNYDEGKTGFVKMYDVGQIRIKPNDEYVGDGVELKKINSSLFSAVNLYATAEMREQDLIADQNGNTIKLYSGDRVTLIKTEGDAAFVMILHNDNSQDFGWLQTSRLIGVHQITTNAIVGLSLLAVAIALATVLLIVYFKRKKRIKRNND